MTSPVIIDTNTYEVPFYDVDSCDVVWHGHYAKYFERARCALLDRVGYNYATMREDGYFFPVVDIQIKFVQPLRFAQTFSIETQLVEWQNRLKINYSVNDPNSNEIITRGHTIQVAVKMPEQTMLLQTPSRLNDKVSELLDRTNES